MAGKGLGKQAPCGTSFVCYLLEIHILSLYVLGGLNHGEDSQEKSTPQLRRARMELLYKDFEVFKGRITPFILFPYL